VVEGLLRVFWNIFSTLLVCIEVASRTANWSFPYASVKLWKFEQHFVKSIVGTEEVE